MYIEEGELEKRSEDQREQRRCEFIEEGEEKRDRRETQRKGDEKRVPLSDTTIMHV